MGCQTEHIKLQQISSIQAPRFGRKNNKKKYADMPGIHKQSINSRTQKFKLPIYENDFHKPMKQYSSSITVEIQSYKDLKRDCLITCWDVQHLKNATIPLWPNCLWYVHMNSLLDFWTLLMIKSCLPTTKHLNYQVFCITQDMPNNENTNGQRYCHWTIKYKMLNWLPTNLAHRYQSKICLIFWNYPQ